MRPLASPDGAPLEAARAHVTGGMRAQRGPGVEGAGPLGPAAYPNPARIRTL